MPAAHSGCVFPEVDLPFCRAVAGEFSNRRFHIVPLLFYSARQSFLLRSAPRQLPENSPTSTNSSRLLNIRRNEKSPVFTEDFHCSSAKRMVEPRRLELLTFSLR